MTIYRVGPDGATVFDAYGRSVMRLRPGFVVVPGTTDTAGSLAAEPQETIAKRIRDYSDKQLRPAEDA